MQKEKEAPLIASVDSQISLDGALPKKELKTFPETANDLKTESTSVHAKVGPPKTQSEEQRIVKQRSEYKERSAQPDYYGPSEKKLNTLALLSFLFAIISVFIAGIPLGIAAMVCGIIGLNQMSKNPETYKGRGFAIVGIVVGAVAVVVVLAYLSTM